MCQVLYDNGEYRIEMGQHDANLYFYYHGQHLVTRSIRDIAQESIDEYTQEPPHKPYECNSAECKYRSESGGCSFYTSCSKNRDIIPGDCILSSRYG